MEITWRGKEENNVIIMLLVHKINQYIRILLRDWFSSDNYRIW